MEIISSSDPAYDRYISAHPHGHLFQSMAWGEHKKLYGWDPIRLLVRSSQKIEAGVSLLSHQLIGAHCMLYAPRGPIMYFDNSSLFTVLLDKIRQIAIDKNAIFLKLDPPLPRFAYKIHAVLLQHGFRLTTVKNSSSLQLSNVYRINLPYRNKSHITLIKSSGQKNRLSVERASGFEHLQIFYGLLLEYSQLTDTKIRSFSYYQHLWQLFKQSGIYLFLVRQKNYLIGASLLICFGRTCYSLYTVYRQRHLGLYPESYLHLAIMEWATAYGFQTYEIMDTFLVAKKGTNTRLFSFPVEPLTYLGEYDLVFNRFKYKLWQLILPIYSWSIKS